MTYEEFVIKTKTLEDFYGKEYNSTQKEIMFDELKYYTSEKFDKAIRFICKINRYKPTLNEILEAMKSSNINTEEKQSVPCKFCNGTGYIFYKKKIGNSEYEYACLCICQNAEGLKYNGSKIADKEHRSKFYIKSAKEVFGDRLPNENNKQQPQQRNIKTLISNLADQMTF